jgi:plastocyanin
MRRLLRAISGVLLLCLLFPGSASAGTVNIIELNFVFTPDPVTVVLGDTVTWENQVENAHTTTDLSPLLLWDSGEMEPQATFSYTVVAAATYPYWCTLHEPFGMFGVLQVRDLVSPPSGPQGTVFTITVATQPAPSGFVYDVQKRNPGGGFQQWMTGVSDPSVAFDSTGQPPGTYSFRSRLRRLSDNKATQFSPRAILKVTG